MQFQNITISNYSIRYAHGGQLDAETVLLLSPLPQSIVAYDSLWAALAQHFNLYAVDLPGFGCSEGGVEVMDVFVQGKLLREIIEELKIKSPHIIAPDVGTPITFAYLGTSDNVTSIMVGDGPAVYPPYMGIAIARMMSSFFWRWFYSLSVNMFISEGNKIGYMRYQPTSSEIEDYRNSYRGRLKGVMAWFSSYDQALPKIDASLDKVSIPVKIFWGDKDAIVLPETAEHLHKRLKRSELQIFENTGHYSYQDAAEEFAQMVINWVTTGHKRIQGSQNSI